MIGKIIEFSARNKFLVFLFLFFAIAWGIWTIKNTPLDALPDLSDTQVIIYTEWPGRSPDLVEDQITYPIASTLLAAPHVQAVRGFSYLGSSFIYVIFDEGTDIYWARSRILEYLQAVKNKIPTDVNPVLGPDATSLGPLQLLKIKTADRLHTTLVKALGFLVSMVVTQVGTRDEHRLVVKLSGEHFGDLLRLDPPKHQ